MFIIIKIKIDLSTMKMVLHLSQTSDICIPEQITPYLFVRRRHVTLMMNLQFCGPPARTP